MFRLFRLSFFLTVLAAVAPAFAHDPGLSSVRVARNDTAVQIQMAFAWTDLARLADGTTKNRPDAAQLAIFVPEILRGSEGMVQLKDSATVLPATAPTFTLDRATPTDVLVNFSWPVTAATPVEAIFPVLKRMPFGHRTIVTLGQSTEAVALLDARHATWKIAAVAGSANAATSSTPVTAEVPASAPLPWYSFIPLGIEHILTGYDHLCFLLALLLVARRFRDVLGVITTFTVAHSITLAAAAMGVVSLSSSIVEPLIAASIVYVGIENLVLKRQPRYRLVLVFCFGLIHGLGFATALAERLPGITGFAVLPPLLSFNLGVEAGQLAVAAVLVPLIKWARTRPDYVPRLQPALSCLVACAGLFWLMQRVWPA